MSVLTVVLLFMLSTECIRANIVPVKARNFLSVKVRYKILKRILTKSRVLVQSQARFCEGYYPHY